MISKIEDTFGVTLPIFADSAVRAGKNCHDFLNSEIGRFNSQDFSDESDMISDEWAVELHYEISQYLGESIND